MKVTNKINQWLWWFILLGFLIMLGELVWSNRIRFLLHPRMNIFVYLGIVLLMALLGHQSLLLTQKSKAKKRFRWGYLVFCLPLMLAATRPQLMASDILENKPLIIGQAEVAAETVTETQRVQDEAIQEETSLEVKDPFYAQVMNLQSNLDQSIGESITIEGFVFKQDNFEPSQMVVARLLITCCASDAGVLGILVESNESLEAFAADSWVRAQGKVTAFTYYDEGTQSEFTLPKLELTLIESIEPYASPYVYPEY